MSSLCKAGLFFLRWITADPSPWGNFTPPTKQCGETLGDLEPVYDLFTIMGEIIPSESLSRVTYTGIDCMHSRKAKQAYIPSARKNPGKSPEKNKKNKPLEENKPEKRTKFLKTALQIA